MLKFWLVVYNIILLPIGWIVIKFLSLFSEKLRKGFQGRKNNISPLLPFKKAGKTVLIHSSSLGEYQQAIPIAEELRKLNYNIILTFFSPSGFDNAKVTDKKIAKLYMPFDFYFTQKKFISYTNPDLILLMRYDLWFNFLYYASKRKIPLMIANARFDEKDFNWKFPPVSSFKKTMYKLIDILFVIDDYDYRNYSALLKNSNCRLIKAGDSKFERVREAARNIKVDNILPSGIHTNKKVFVIGSSWKDDEDVLLPVLDKISADENILILLVPHEPKETKISAIEKNIDKDYNNLKHIRLSKIDLYQGENIIIVDSIGKLLSLYSIAYAAYVGGGFRTGLHNVLEPAIFNIPVFFANEQKNSDEDEIMLEKGCGIRVTDKRNFYRELKIILKSKLEYDRRANTCKEVFEENMGTTKKIIETILNYYV